MLPQSSPAFDKTPYGVVQLLRRGRLRRLPVRHCQGVRDALGQFGLVIGDQNARPAFEFVPVAS
jgi:hypothetical protein